MSNKYDELREAEKERKKNEALEQKQKRENPNSDKNNKGRICPNCGKSGCVLGACIHPKKPG